jgi:hypothetical protein
MSSNENQNSENTQPKLYIPTVNRPTNYPEVRKIKNEDYLSYMTIKDISQIDMKESIFSEKATKEMQNSWLLSTVNADAKSNILKNNRIQILNGLFNDQRSTQNLVKQQGNIPNKGLLSKTSKKGEIEPKQRTEKIEKFMEPLLKIINKKDYSREEMKSEQSVNSVKKEDISYKKLLSQKRAREREKYIEALEILLNLGNRNPSLTEINRLIYSFGHNFNYIRKHRLDLINSMDAKSPKIQTKNNEEERVNKYNKLRKMLEMKLNKDQSSTSQNQKDRKIKFLNKRDHFQANIHFEPFIKDEQIESKVREALQDIKNEDLSFKNKSIEDDHFSQKEDTKQEKQFSGEEFNNLLNLMFQKNNQQINIKTLNANIKTINNYSNETVKKNDRAKEAEDMNQLRPLMNDIRNYYMDPVSKSIFLKVTSSENGIDENEDYKYNLISVSKLIKKQEIGQNRASLKNFDLQNLQNLFETKTNSSELYIKFPLLQKNLKKKPLSSVSKKNIKKSSSRKNKKSKKKRSMSKKQEGCKCTKSRCLRLHCVCFSNKQFCGDNCKCSGCYNKTKFASLVEEVRKVTKDINSEAFESKFVTIEKEGKLLKYTKGCSCSKNNCLKNYCECRKYNMPCTPLCKCEGCKNSKIDLEPEIAKKLCKRKSRKKKKIVFKAGNNKKLKFTQQILSTKSTK